MKIYRQSRGEKKMIERVMIGVIAIILIMIVGMTVALWCKFRRW
jgi:hypothetical protein